MAGNPAAHVLQLEACQSSNFIIKNTSLVSFLTLKNKEKVSGLSKKYADHYEVMPGI